MIGEAFEVSRVDDKGEITHFARTLNRIDGVFHQLMILNGECISRDESPDVIYFTQGEYGHCTLDNDEDCLLSFKPLPYRPDQYPLKDIANFNVYENKPEGKLWAYIVDKNNDHHVVYMNNQTSGRLVYQHLQSGTSLSQRISDKVKKGYIDVGYAFYCSQTRSLKY